MRNDKGHMKGFGFLELGFPEDVREHHGWYVDSGRKSGFDFDVDRDCSCGVLKRNLVEIGEFEWFGHFDVHNDAEVEIEAAHHIALKKVEIGSFAVLYRGIVS